MAVQEITTMEQIIMKQPGHITSDMGDEKVMMNIENGQYYNLGQVGGTIWEMLEQPIAIREVVAQLMQQYGVTLAVCEQQVRSFLDDLLAENLVCLVEGDRHGCEQ